MTSADLLKITDAWVRDSDYNGDPNIWDCRQMARNDCLRATPILQTVVSDNLHLLHLVRRPSSSRINCHRAGPLPCVPVLAGLMFAKEAYLVELRFDVWTKFFAPLDVPPSAGLDTYIGHL